MAIEFTKRQKIVAVVFVSLVIIALFSWIVWRLVSDSECIRPSNTTGYNNITETNLSMGSEFDVSVDCASGYDGTASATVCSVAGQAYTLTGCSVTTQPVGSRGDSTNSPCSLSTLTQPTNGSWGTTCSSNSGEIQHGASCDLSCNTGYTPSNQPTCNNGELSSTTLTCTPEPAPTCSDTPCGTGAGVICTDNSGGGYTCSCDSAAGYTGANVVDGPATCTPAVCRTGQDLPNIFVSSFRGVQRLQNISDSEQETNNPCAGTAVGTSCNLGFDPCPDGYIGGTIMCQADGNWGVVPCREVVCNYEPNITDQHMMSITADSRISSNTGETNQCRGAHPDEICEHECHAGYEGGSVTCVRDGDTASWNIEACTEVPVVTPPVNTEVPVVTPPVNTEVPVVTPPVSGAESDTTTFTWILGDIGNDCTTTCSGDYTCSGDGDWGVNSVYSFNEKITLANQDYNTLCNSYIPLDISGPGVLTSDRCSITNAGHISNCSDSRSDIRRLCRCT